MSKYTKQDIIRMAEEEDVEFIRLQFTDMFGTLKNVRMPRRKKRKSSFPVRSEEEKEMILRAKELLMERNHMTEQEAHRYLQKSSMESGTSLPEAAQMILSMMQ